MKSKIIIESINKNLEFFLKKNNLTIYSDHQFLSFISHVTQADLRFVSAYLESEILATMPYFEKNGKYGKVTNSLPFYGSLSSVVLNKNFTHNESTESVIAAIYSTYNQLTDDENIISSNIVSNPFQNNENLINSNYLYKFKDSRICQYLILDNSYDQIFSNYSSSRKRNLKKSNKYDFQISFTHSKEVLSAIEEIHIENMLAINGKSKPSMFFEFLPKYIDKDKWNIIYALQEEEFCAGILFFQTPHYLEYYVPVVLEKFRSTQVLSLLVDSLIKYALKYNIKIFNFGGTWAQQEGVYTFKKKWGCLEENYSYFIKCGKISKSELKKYIKEYKFFYIRPL